MPLYSYKCSHCDHSLEDFRPVDERGREDNCPECSLGVLKRDFQGELHSTPQTDWTDPILSEAAGIHPDQIAEVKARFPHHEFHPDGRMIFRSRAHQKRCLRDIGFVDKDSYG